LFPKKLYLLSVFGVTTRELSSKANETESDLNSKLNSHNGHFTVTLLPSILASTLSAKTTGNFHILDIL